MKTNNRFLFAVAFAAIAFTFFACSGDDSPPEPPGGELSSDSSGGVEPPPSSSSGGIFGYCDYGRGECYPMTTDDDAANCAAWGQVVSSCPTIPSSSSNTSPPSSSSVTPPPPSSSSITPPPPPSSSSSIVFGSFIYLDQTYKTVKIGNQTWMAENLNRSMWNSTSTADACYDNLTSNCNSLGRLYTWAEAMGLSSTCNTSNCASQINTKHTGLCPAGWHIPSFDDWNTLMGTIGGSATGGKKLKTKSSWENKFNGESGNGTDEYGFGALPGGQRSFGGGNNFASMYYGSYWWSSETEAGYNTTAYAISMSYSDDKVGWSAGFRQEMNYVRCVKD